MHHTRAPGGRHFDIAKRTAVAVAGASITAFTNSVHTLIGRTAVVDVAAKEVKAVEGGADREGGGLVGVGGEGHTRDGSGDGRWVWTHK